MELDRRSFVKGAAASVALVVLGSDLMARSANAGPVNVGKPADFPAGGPTSDKFAKSDKVLVARDGDKIYAMTAVCTHRGGTVVLNAGKLTCPNHKSIFGADGKPTGGPAKEALARYAISLNSDGQLIVDKSKQFKEPQWTDAASFVTVKPA